jgi:hypothetical protein
MPKKNFARQEDCDPANPDEHFLWALMTIPYGPKQTQPIQQNIARTMSRHLHELGFRHHPKLQTKTLQMPLRGDKTNLNGSAIWVPIGTEVPEPIEDSLPNVDSMTPQEREHLDRELDKYRKIQSNPVPEHARARETSWKEVRSRHVKKASEVINGTDTGTGPAE